MLNTMIVAAITNFSGTTTPDKNGETPVMLQCIAGTMPNRNVLSGTVAKRAGFEVGKTYLINVREVGYDDIYGTDYSFIKIMQLESGLDIVKASKELGEPHIIFVVRPEGFENVYTRKGDAVESNRAARIKEGSYHPAYPTTIGEHNTARNVVRGSSQNSGGELHIQDLAHLDMEFPEPELSEFPEPGEDENLHNMDDDEQNLSEEEHNNQNSNDDENNAGNQQNTQNQNTGNRGNQNRGGGNQNRNRDRGKNQQN